MIYPADRIVSENEIPVGKSRAENRIESSGDQVRHE